MIKKNLESCGGRAEKKMDELMDRKTTEKVPIKIAKTIMITGITIACVAVLYVLLNVLLMSSGNATVTASDDVTSVSIMDKFDMIVTNKISKALDGVISVEKSYWLNDEDLVAPKPAQEKYGQADSAEELAWLLKDAEKLLDGQEMLFNTSTPVWEKDKVYYYYDETILVITWKQIIDGMLFNLSEVKIAHPSQFRRFLAGGEFGCDKQYTTTEMASSVNAVMATSGDFYKFRRKGVVVYEGKLQRFEGKGVDTCFITEDGDLMLSYRGDFANEQEAADFIKENKVRFSLVFGPVLVDNGEVVKTEGYGLGEVNSEYTRAALCQMDKLHYLVASVTGEPSNGYTKRPTVAQFAEKVHKFGVDKAYTLDGGQTTVICMDGKLISNPDFNVQRTISDIVYFATAIPNME